MSFGPGHFCHACGWPYADVRGVPRVCTRCGTAVYNNPHPVAVALLPVSDKGRTGILIGERGIEPGLGKWGLPGGYVDEADPNLRSAAQRELWEETGVTVPVDEFAYLYDFNNGKQALSFWITARTLTLDEVEKVFVPCPECPAVGVAFEPRELAFSSHTEALLLALARIWL